MNRQYSRQSNISRRRSDIVGYDVRPIVHARRTPKEQITPAKPNIAEYRLKKPVASIHISTPEINVRAVNLKTRPLSYQDSPAPVTRKRARRPKSRANKKQFVISGVAVAVFLFGVVVSIDGFRKNQAVGAQVVRQSSAVAVNDEVLEDDEPTDRAVRSHTVPADAPRYLMIEKFGIKSRIKAVDTNANGELGVPKNIFDVGWYQSGSKPGESGAVLLDGHVSSPRKAGVFKKLSKLEVGDIVAIERGDGKMVKYKVVMGKSFPADKVDMQSAVTPITPGKPGLNLITCHGKVKPGTNEFSERYIVYSEQI